jgi:cysteine desulfurase
MKLWSKKVYADTAASTLPDSKVVAVMMQIMKTNVGNPASIHSAGKEAGKILDDSRAKVAKILQARPEEIIFTSGGTESNNLAIRGVFEAYYKKTGKGGHIITSAIEHKSVLEVVEGCKIFGGKVTVLPVDSAGQVSLSALRDSLTDDTILISIGLVNNEIGTVVDIKQISKVISDFRRRQGTAYPYLHTDACQAPRFFPLHVDSFGVDLLTFNGSKIYGPKGVGVLYVKNETKISSIILGGGQEFGLRSGTPSICLVAGLATALEICETTRLAEVKNVTEVRDYLAGEIKKRLPESIFYGPTDNPTRSPNNLNVGFPEVMAEDLVIGLDVLGIEVSTGSACSSKSKPESHVLKAIGGNMDFSSVRFSLGRDTNKKEANIVVDALVKEVGRLRRK